MQLIPPRGSKLTVFPLVHAAVIAINEAVDRNQATLTMGAMNNPNAMLKNLQEALAQGYQDTLRQAKARKMSQSSGRVRSSGHTPGNTAKLTAINLIIIVCVKICYFAFQGILGP